MTESINFLSDKFKEYEENKARKDKITVDLRSEAGSLSTKVEKLKFQDQQEQYSRRNSLLLHGIAEEKEEIRGNN